jgi:hypothetical protein
LTLTAQRLVEHWNLGRLEPGWTEPRELRTRVVQRKKFRATLSSSDPGLYRVNADLKDMMQDRSGFMFLRDDYHGPRHWDFTFDVLGNDILLQAGSALDAFDRIADAARVLVRRYEAAATAATWNLVQNELSTEARKIDVTVLRRLFPASAGDLSQAIDALQHPPAYRIDEEGRLGLRYPHWVELRKSIAGAVDIAGREYCLWVLKETRRRGMSEDIKEAFRRHAKHPGVIAYAHMLENIETTDTAILERDIRGDKSVADDPSYPLPPAPPPSPLERRWVEAQRLLTEADGLWETDSASAIVRYKTLLKDYSDLLHLLQARTRAQRRAEQED